LYSSRDSIVRVQAGVAAPAAAETWSDAQRDSADTALETDGKGGR
jgi:hypothetical protein